MSTDVPTPTSDVNESDIASARLSPRSGRSDRKDEHGDVLTGGDARHAPHSLSEGERRPPTGASSGTSWDDPDEL